MGSPRYGTLGVGKIDADINVAKPLHIKELKNIVDIAASNNVSFAIDNYGKLYSWGANYTKQLAQDDEEDYLSPVIVCSKQVDVRDVYSVSAGGQHTLFIMSDEKIKN